MIDGASHVQTFFRSSCRWSRPILAVCSLLVFVSVIGEFLLASIFLTDGSKKTLATGLYGLIDGDRSNNLGCLRRGGAAGRDPGDPAVPVPPTLHRRRDDRRRRQGVTSSIGALDPHHDGSPLYRPEPPALGARIPLRVRVPHTAEGRPAADHVVLRSVRDGEPYVVEATQESTDEAGTWWTADLHVHNPLTTYRFLLTEGRSKFRWLNAERRARPRRHRRRRLPGQHRAPAARLGGGPGRLPGLPRPVRAHRDRRARPRPGRTRPTGTTRSSTRGRGWSPSCTAARSTASPGASTT